MQHFINTLFRESEMTNKTTKGKKQISAEEKRISRQRRILQVVMVVFSIILILSMVLSLTANF